MNYVIILIQANWPSELDILDLLRSVAETFHCDFGRSRRGGGVPASCWLVLQFLDDCFKALKNSLLRRFANPDYARR